MNKKQLLFFFLAGSLLVLPVTYYYAISLDELKDKVQKFIEENAIKAVLPSLAIAAGIAGGLYYLMSTKNENVPQEDKNIFFEQANEPIIVNGEIITNEKIKGLYASSLGFLEDMVILISKDPEERIKQYDFTNKGIQKYLKNSLSKLKNETNEDLITLLQTSKMIEKYFNLNRIRENFLSNNFLLKLPDLIEIINNKLDLQEEFKGEWLSDGELEYLWNEKDTEIVSQNAKCGFKAIANFELVGNLNIDPEFDEVAVYIKENIQSVLNQKMQTFMIFALGDMRQTGETTGTRGHWYPLVMHQDNKGKRKYYIMDSASCGNINRLKDENSWKIINLIEKSASPLQEIIEQPELKQFQVYCQFNEDGGGAASCGYQTLLRSMQTVRGKYENESDAALEKTLNDPFSIALYFGEKNSEWRKAIIARRKEQELKKDLHAKFLSAFIKY